jgi:hypothetical protein
MQSRVPDAREKQICVYFVPVAGCRKGEAAENEHRANFLRPGVENNAALGEEDHILCALSQSSMSLLAWSFAIP